MEYQMLRYLFIFAIFIINSLPANAQTVFVTNSGNNTASVTFRTGFSDVACAGGVCLVPSNSHDAVAVIPQSTAFFALSNPQVFQFRVRNFTQTPHTNAIVSVDSHGNQIQVLNAGIHHQVVPKSRGQIIFAR